MTEDANRTTPKPPSVDRVSQLWRRINDHKMVQWSVAYVALAYGVQHAVTLITEAFEWPHAVERVSMLLLAFGLPLVMTLAWYHGARASRRISGPELTIISILLVMSSLLFFVFVRPSSELAAPAVRQASVAAARIAAADPHGAIALAVLPFANLSDDRQQEFFSDGITDEIGTALAKIADLRVVARQSAYRFKGGKEDARTIGQQLSATHLLEGSVRKAGNRVRISAELVKADDGLRIWAENYDRDLTDVFGIQEDIAHAIAASLHMTLGLKAGENLVNARTASPQLHEAYLRAKGLVKVRRLSAEDDAIRILEDVVASDPNYAAAWGLLATAHYFRLLGEPTVLSGSIEKARDVINQHMSKARTSAERAVQLDPKGADGYVAIAEIKAAAGDYVGGVQALDHVLALDPDDPEALQAYSIRLAHAGFTKQALPLRDHLEAVEPFVPAYRSVTARLLFGDGQTDKAIALLQDSDSVQIIEILAAAGRYKEAADRMRTARRNLPQMQNPEFAAAVDTAAKLISAAPAAAPPNSPDLGILNWVYVYTGAPDRLMGAYERGVRLGFQSIPNNGTQWAPAYAAVRKTERFKKNMRESGIVAYWRAKGWPPQCHPTTGDDFACD